MDDDNKTQRAPGRRGSRRRAPVEHCGFCGNSHQVVGPLVEGDALGPRKKVYICSTCNQNVTQNFIEVVREQSTDQQAPRKELAAIRATSPQEVYSHLNQFVIGQDQPKKIMSVQVSNHYRRLIDQDEKHQDLLRTTCHDQRILDCVIEKSNILMVGPSGSGKTLLAQALAEKLNVPFAIGDATSITEAGYVGEDVENLLLKLLIAADYDVAAAERGIIYIDEIDKLRKSGGNTSITRDVSGEGVQQSLLKMIEGTIANVPPEGGRKHPEQKYIQINTKNILFMVGGAFVGLDDIVRRRVNKKTLGFGQTTTTVDAAVEKNLMLHQVTPEDLIEFGLIPELVGRLPVLSVLDGLSVADLERVLTEPKNALLLQEQKKLLYHGVKLDFTPDAIHEIATRAAKAGTGARALRSIVEKFMMNVHFNLPKNCPGKRYVIDKAVVEGKRDPLGPPTLFPTNNAA